MSTLYNRAFTWKALSLEALNRIELDDSYLDAACFNAQQSLEFLMKYILQQYGVVYKKTHNIRELYNLLMGANFSFTREDELDRLADTVTSWEEGSRYTSGVRTTKETVYRVYKIFESINDSFLNIQESNNRDILEGDISQGLEPMSDDLFKAE